MFRTGYITKSSKLSQGYKKYYKKNLGYKCLLLIKNK